MKRIRTRKRRPTCAARLETLESRTLLAAAPFDPTFGVDGKGRYDIAGPSDLDPRDQPTVYRDTRGALVRLNPDGSLDQSFGDAGVARHQSDPFTWVDWRQLPDVTRIDSI